MSDFITFRDAVNRQFDTMATQELFVTDVDKDLLWETYLGAFDAETNPLFRERTVHDCQCCRQFIRACGSVVAIHPTATDVALDSIWDIDIGGPYQRVADAMAALVKSRPIRDVYRSSERSLGTKTNHEYLFSEIEDTDKYMKPMGMLAWDHFYFQLPLRFKLPEEDIGTALSKYRSSKDVFKRALEEISTDALDTVLELIASNSIYRGEEHRSAVDTFLSYKVGFDAIRLTCGGAFSLDRLVWHASVLAGGVARIRNTAIGTLLVDLSEGVSLDAAVAKYESKVAPENYKRPTALVSKAMIAKAQRKVAELGIEGSLARRYATVEDITVNNVLFADRTARKAMNVFDELAEEVPHPVQSLSRVEEVSIQTLIDDILPKADGLEVMVENKHVGNLMSLIAPQDSDAPRLFKWASGFSWSYNGEVTDSIKERVKHAGGNVDGVLRCSLAWFNYDDLDIHVTEPCGGEHIYYGNRSSSTSGTLDVDMNINAGGSRNAVENIVWTNKSRMVRGVYHVEVHNYTPRETVDVGFDAEIEFEGVTHSFHYPSIVKRGRPVSVAEFRFSQEKGIEILESLPSTQSTQEIWGVNTHTFRKVSLVMNSPNHWDGEATGNKHYFFMLEGCANPGTSRGFYNEFLKPELHEHRKVFEVLGAKMRVKEANDQLSGLGFSSTQRNQVLCRVTGAFSRVIKVNF